MPAVEVVNPAHPRGPFRVALWDFDGTVSLYRGGWQRVMIDMMVAELAPVARGESADQLARMAEEWVVAHTGRPTIHQMECLVREISARGGTVRTGEAYCGVFQEQLLTTVDQRIAEVTRGEKPPLAHGVAGVANMLEALLQRGLMLVLASGTEREYVVGELHLRWGCKDTSEGMFMRPTVTTRRSQRRV